MIRFRFAFYATILCVMTFMSAAAVHGDVREDVREATHGFRDVVVTARVVHANHSELAKIGSDFQKSYEIKTSTISFRAPDKMRMEGKVGIIHFVIIINGDIKAYRIPAVHYTSKENIKDKPHQRQNELDVGILTASLWKDYIVTDARMEHSAQGPIYKIVFVRENAREKNMVLWADARTMKLLKMEKYEKDGSLKARYIYSDHKEFHGIWVPGRIDVYNKNGKLAATTVYEDIKVNAGIPDSLFAIK